MSVKNQNVYKLATVILAKISDTLLERIRSETNKQSATYPVVLSDPLVIREEWIENKHNNKAVKNRKRKERKRYQNKKHYENTIESRKEHIKNLSNTQLADEQITLLSHGLKFIPVPVTRENLIRRQLLSDFYEFARRMSLQYIFYEMTSGRIQKKLEKRGITMGSSTVRRSRKEQGWTLQRTAYCQLNERPTR